jgi:hypothetical protein
MHHTAMEYTSTGFMINAFGISALRNLYRLNQCKTMGTEVLTKTIHSFEFSK